MLVIRRNQNNKIVATVSRHKTIANPNYLFSFEHILSKEKVRFFPKNISTNTNRYDEFEFNEGLEPTNYTGDVPYEVFPFPGQYYYSIYECFTTNSTNPQYAYEKLEEGRAIVEDDSIPDPYGYVYTSSNEENSNYIYYTPGTNEERALVGIGYNAGNSYSLYYTWRYDYPNVKVKDLETGVIETLDTVLYDESDCGGFGYASGDTLYKEITTGSTWAGFKIYMDETEVISKGYELGRLDGLPSVTGITFTNFAQSFIPTYYSATRTYHYDDGTEYTTNVPVAFKKDGTPL